MPTNSSPISSGKSSPLKTAAIIFFTIVISVTITIWVMTKYIFPRHFEPVELSKKEQVILDRKVNIFQGWGDSFSASASATDDTLQAEKYSEENADRIIEFSERELNAMLAKNTDLAQRLAIDLSNNLASGKLLIPLDPDFPVMGGKTLKLSAGLELAYANERPIVVLKGVSVMGVPIPNAWLGGLKNVDLVSEFGDAGFWKAFATGVELIKVEEGQLVIKLKE